MWESDIEDEETILETETTATRIPATETVIFIKLSAPLEMSTQIPPLL